MQVSISSQFRCAFRYKMKIQKRPTLEFGSQSLGWSLEEVGAAM